MGWTNALVEAALHRVFIQGGLYILGAVLYACRIPERFLPGKCDFWFQSHQIFHILVIAAAFVHFHGMQNIALYRLTKAGACSHSMEVEDFQPPTSLQTERISTILLRNFRPVMS